MQPSNIYKVSLQALPFLVSQKPARVVSVQLIEGT